MSVVFTGNYVSTETDVGDTVRCLFGHVECNIIITFIPRIEVKTPHLNVFFTNTVGIVLLCLYYGQFLPSQNTDIYLHT